MEEATMANAVATRSEQEASANAGLEVATDCKCSSRSELLVEWPSPCRKDRTSSGRQQKSAVHFSETAQIKVIPSLLDYSPERIERTYYTQADYAELKTEYAATTKAMHRRHRRGEDPLQVHEVQLSGTRQEPHPHRQQRPSPTTITTATTTRGLEHMAAASTLEFHWQEQRSAIDAVLLAQEGNIAPEEIALLYGRRARMAKTRAARQGLEDAQHAARY